jgi:hypothetical protein
LIALTNKYTRLIGARTWANLGFEYRDSKEQKRILTKIKKYYMTKYNKSLDLHKMVDHIKYPYQMLENPLLEDYLKNSNIYWMGVFFPGKTYEGHLKLGIRHFYKKYLSRGFSIENPCL